MPHLPDEAVARDLYEASLALIRPDQIVVWRGAGLGADAVRAVFDTVTGLTRSPA